MPRYRQFCKSGEKPAKQISGKEFEYIFGVRTWRRPMQGVYRADCPHSHIPKEWVPAVQRLINKIRETYTMVGLDGDTEGKEVLIEQIKDKFGELRIYYIAERGLGAREKIDKWIEECIGELKEADPFYGQPY